MLKDILEFINENRLISVGVLVFILGMVYVAQREYKCRSLGGIPLHGQCLKVPLIDMEVSDETSG